MILRRVALAFFVVTALSWADAAVASGHDDTGSVTVVAAAPTGPLTVSYEIDVTYTNDGEGAPRATVTVVAEGSGGLVGPITMVAAEPVGRYTATVTFPVGGTWALRFSSLSPLATANRVEEVAGAPPAPPSSPVTTPSGVTTSPAGPTTTGGEGVPSRPAEEVDGGDSWGGPAVGVLAVVAVAALAAAVVARRAGRARRRAS